MGRRRLLAWGRGGVNVRGRKRSVKTCLQRKLRELQRTIPGSYGMDAHTLLITIENYITSLEAKVSVLRCLSTFYGV
ncbi:hypothetical protein L6164_014126 [Bauhinia variegata]|uniref:Uncharacterized protein n=1 Tax=Bauhinia variegata TaxID=167791 RepID=A0ACB9NHK7_BAUVA|nr:hypothetical protein L6164_014126 [Bauhinia variegata]